MQRGCTVDELYKRHGKHGAASLILDPSLQTHAQPRVQHAARHAAGALGLESAGIPVEPVGAFRKASSRTEPPRLPAQGDYAEAFAGYSGPFRSTSYSLDPAHPSGGPPQRSLQPRSSDTQQQGDRMSGYGASFPRGQGVHDTHGRLLDGRMDLLAERRLEPAIEAPLRAVSSDVRAGPALGAQLKSQPGPQQNGALLSQQLDSQFSWN